MAANDRTGASDATNAVSAAIAATDLAANAAAQASEYAAVLRPVAAAANPATYVREGAGMGAG